jgi:FlaA1/EpsC-like NDP-sugar epimerase
MMAKNTKTGSRSIKLVVFEGALIAYATYFTALALDWLGMYGNAHTFGTLSNTILFVISVLTINLSVGLYEQRLREPFRGIIRRIFVSTVISYFVVVVVDGIIFDVASAHYLHAPFSVALIVITLVIFRYFVYRTESFASKPNLVVLGAGVRAAVIENRMRREVDRNNFNLISFIPVSKRNG